jgi:D-alanyl-lipoteichoic acid acyltransferase DltB (MBOAT superfamily)
MALGGLWHGANWTFVIWGILHGLFLIVHRAFRDFADLRPRLELWLQTMSGKAFGAALTFVCVCIGWVFFRCQTLAEALAMLGRMSWPVTGSRLPLDPANLYATLVFVAVCHAVVASGLWNRLTNRLPAPAWSLGYSVATGLVLAQTMAPESGKAFIYFQF